MVATAIDNAATARRLGLALAASVALHVALALWPAEQPERPQTGLPLLARLAAAPAPPSKAPAAAKAGPHRPKASAPARTAAAQAASDFLALRRRTASTIVLPAAGEIGEELQAAKLGPRLREVPRSETLPRPAQPRRPIAARYPAQALERGVRGHVLLEAIVGARGRAVEVVVIDDQDKPELAAAAIQAVRRAAFEPARDAAGAPTPSRVALRVEFSFE